MPKLKIVPDLGSAEREFWQLRYERGMDYDQIALKMKLTVAELRDLEHDMMTSLRGTPIEPSTITEPPRPSDKTE